eukprot:365121-Rhodomonas_salina.1
MFWGAGVKYIFWSGWVAVERTSREFFPTFPLDEEGGFFPWMTNTDGVEEIIMVRSQRVARERSEGARSKQPSRLEGRG